jgi:hypothetical protein
VSVLSVTENSSTCELPDSTFHLSVYEQNVSCVLHVYFDAR